MAEAERGARADSYDHRKIEPKWIRTWDETGIYRADLAGAEHPYLNLMMFPYPSGEGLHMGHVYAFSGADMNGRFQAMRGNDVFQPMGFDAFGIHSENYAIKVGMHPKLLTARTIERFREGQLKRIGARFDWSKEVQTTDPRYYKWTQWIFVQLYKAGLAVRKSAPVDWCPSCKTVLADEQVIGGRCERCNTEVVQRELEQWFFKITDYAQRLLDNLDWIDWSDMIKRNQREWIGRSEGLEFRMPVAGHEGVQLSVFTTRPDTVFGVTYAVLAPEHKLVSVITTPDRRAEVDAYVASTRALSEQERKIGERGKTGVFTGAYAVNPANDERVPIWIADYVLATYGTGAIMAVPAHDQRDFEFATEFGLEIREVIAPPAEAAGYDAATRPALAAAWVEPGVMVNSGQFSGVESVAGKTRVAEWFEERGVGKRTVLYHLRDWLISRQRYWGPPIPIIYCDDCGTVPVPEEDLPVLLPDVEEYQPTSVGSSPLARVPSFVNTTCPKCGKPARRETDVSDTFLDSAWYFIRYPSANRDDVPWDADLTRKWLPVSSYIGGPEHSNLHLLYSRFVCLALRDLGLIDFSEPYARFRAHGMITKDGRKMSKTWGNVVNPDEYISKYGADTMRMYAVFIGPYDQGGDFSDRDLGGMVRFVHRIWMLVTGSQISGKEAPREARQALHRTIRRVTDDLEALKYNTAIAGLMEYLNFIQKQPTLHAEEARALLLMLAPLAPFVTEELWAAIGGKYSIHQQRWPAYDPALVALEQIEVPVQVNGRVREVLTVPADSTEEQVRELALASERVQRHLGGKPVRKLIYVPGRLVNIVV
jgi:leucyl-tRNA synthetase